MTGMDPMEILERWDTGELISYEELGFLLPYLARKKQLVADTPQWCHTTLITCFYHLRGVQFVWAAAHQAQDQDGRRIKLSAKALPTAQIPVGWFAVTRCRDCGDGFHLIMKPDRSISILRGSAPTFAKLAEPSPPV
jgi:hypothetical protein